MTRRGILADMGLSVPTTDRSHQGAFCPSCGSTIYFGLDELGRIVPRCFVCEDRARTRARLDESELKKQRARMRPCEGCPNGRVALRRNGKGRQPRFCDDCRKERARAVARTCANRKYAKLTPKEKTDLIASRKAKARRNVVKWREQSARWQRTWRARKKNRARAAA